MFCYKHQNNHAVAKCSECGRGLCNECANKIDPPMCVECAREEASEIMTTMIINIAISVVLMIVGIVIIESPLGFLLAGIPYGWSILNKITPSMFLWLSWIGWIIYFFIKLVIAYFIGIIALPIKLYRWISQYISMKKLLDAIEE